MQWCRNRVVLPLQTSLLELQENEQIIDKARDKNWCNMREAVIVEDACVDTSEESLPLFSALSERPNVNRNFQQYSNRTPKTSKPTYNIVTNYESNWYLEQALISAREEIINLLAMNLRSTYETGLVRDGFIVEFDEDVGGLGCHVGNSYATTSHLFLEDTQICLKSGTLHYDKTSCADKQHNSLEVSENITSCANDSKEEEYEFYECLQEKEKASHVRHLQELPIYTTKWERSSSYSLQRSIINNDETLSNAEDVDLSSLHRLHQHHNYCNSNNIYDMSEFIGLSRSGVHKFVITNGGSELAWLSHCHCTDEINVDVTCTDDWGLHCSVVGLSSGELVVVDWRCSQNNNMNRPVLVSSVPRPPWEYTSRSRTMASTLKEVNTAAITSCAAFESNYRVLAGLKDHHGSLVITDLRRPSKDYFSKQGKTTYLHKTPRKLLTNCHHSRGKWEKMIISQFVNGAGCLPTGHPISEIVHCPGNINRVGLVDIHGQAMCLFMNALEHGECNLYEHDYKEPTYRQHQELLDTNKWRKSNNFAENVIGKHNENAKTKLSYKTRLKRIRGTENTYIQMSNNNTSDITNKDIYKCSGNNEENNSHVNIIDVDAFVDSDSNDDDDNYSSYENDDCSKGQETNNVNRAFCNGNVVSAEVSLSSSSSSVTCLLPQRENMLSKRVHSHQYVQNAHSHSIYEMALRSLSPLLSADEQTILRLQNVQMQLESKRNKIARRCVFSSDGKLLVHSTHSLLGISIMPASCKVFHHESNLLSTCETNSVAATSATARKLYSMETFRVHHKACCNRKGDAIVGVSVAGHNVLSVTTMLGQTWNILLEEDRSVPERRSLFIA